MTATRRKLLENFDDEVREKLKVSDEASKSCLNRYERLLINLARHELNGDAQFLDDSSFLLQASPFADVPLGRYELPRRSGEAHLFRLNHPLAEALIAQAKSRELPAAKVRFNYKDHEGIISILAPIVGKSGWLSLSSFTVESLDQAEDHLIFSGLTDDGTMLDENGASRLFTLPGEVLSRGAVESAEEKVKFSSTESLRAPTDLHESLNKMTQERQAAVIQSISERNAHFFEAEAAKLDGWADDLKLGLEREIKEFDRLIKEARRAASTVLTLEEKLAAQKQIKALESQRHEKRRSLFEAQDRVDQQREELISNIEGKLNQRSGLTELFTIRWSLV
jgi:adenine-specific DNA-methyltransferase